MSHTPGPWEIGDELAGSIIISPVGQCMHPWIADVKGEHVGPKSREEIKANAALIAASPDLLAALEMVRDADDDCRKDGLPTMPPLVRGKVDHAIAKATGGQP